MIDREAAADEWATHLASTGHLVAVGKRPDGGGWQSDGSFVPHVIVWPQPSTYGAMLADLHDSEQNILQATCVANDPGIAGRIATDIVALAAAPPATLAGRTVIEARVETTRGPHRDPEDQRLWTCQVLPRIWTI